MKEKIINRGLSNKEIISESVELLKQTKVIRNEADFPLEVLQDEEVEIELIIEESEDNVNWKFVCSGTFKGNKNQIEQPWINVDTKLPYVRNRYKVKSNKAVILGGKIVEE